MDVSVSGSVKIGEVFTPVNWAEWVLRRWHVYERWRDGASVCDPTAGQGAFAIALLRIAKAHGVLPDENMLSRLVLIELNPENLRAFKEKAREEFSIVFSSDRLLSCDVIRHPPHKVFDILVGNPPWSNFTELPACYKEALKPYFISSGLVPMPQKLLLGSSRIDISALVLKVVLGKLLSRNGEGCFFVPRSLFCGGDAHSGFRDYHAGGRAFCVDEVFDFTRSKVFSGIATSYCCAHFTLDREQAFPVRYFTESSSSWEEHQAVPLHAPCDQWWIRDCNCDVPPLTSFNVPLRPEQKPRQGVNTCGANSIFIFDRKPHNLPHDFLYPLATGINWKMNNPSPAKWLMLPYDPNTGRVLSRSQLEYHKQLCAYLDNAREWLTNRKGALMRTFIDRGIWWALLGVGSYSFAPYKVIWEAYGKGIFKPLILGSYEGNVWQANQAMQAFIPCQTREEATRILVALQHPDIPRILRQLNGNGKRNWAQPGKIKKILSMCDPPR